MNPLNNQYNTDFFKRYGQSLADAPDKEQRKKLQATAAEQALESLTSQIAFDFDQFVNLHLPLDAINSPFEGNTIEASLSFWKSFIEALCKNEGCSLPLDISPAQLHAVKEALQEVETYLTIIKKCHTANPAIVTPLAQELRAFVTDSLQRKGEVYVMHGYRDGPNNHGHGIPALYERQGRNVNANLFNQGAGSEAHPILDFTETGEIISYRFFPIEIQLSRLQNKVGLHLFYKDILIQTNQPSAVDTPYSSQDIYGALEIVGTVHPSKLGNLQRMRKKRQIGMTCADKAIKMVVNDVLIRKGVSHQTMKRLFCLARLNSLIMGYHYLSQSRASSEKLSKAVEQYEKALRTFAVAVKQRAKEYLSKEEVSFCKGLVATLQANVPGLKRAEIVLPQTISLKSLRCSTTFPPFESAASAATSSSQPGSASDDNQPVRKPLPPTHIQSYDIHLLKQLKDCVAAANTIEKQGDYSRLNPFIYALFNNLQDPDPEGNDPWGQVPSRDMADVIDQLKRLVLYYAICYIQLRDISQRKEVDVQLVHIIYKAYCIADRLARRNPKTKLAGFHSQNWLQEWQFQFGLICSGSIDRSLTKCMHYLAKINEGHKKPLFYFPDRIDIAEGVRSLKSLELFYHPATIHLIYLNQFYDDAAAKGLFNRHAYSPENYTDLWMDEKGLYLPKEVHGLRELSYLAQILYYRFKGAKAEQLHPETFVAYKNDNNASFLTSSIKWQPNGSPEFISDPLNCDASRFDTLFRNSPETQNEASLIKVDDKRETALIRKERSLHFVSLLSWIRKDPSLFSYGTSMVEGLLLTKGIIQEEVRRNPVVVSEFRAIFKESFDRYKKDSSLSNLIRMVIYAETHIKTVQGDGYDYSMSYYLDHLIRELPQEPNIMVLKGLLYAIMPPLQIDSLEPFLLTAFKSHTSCREGELGWIWKPHWREAQVHLQNRQRELEPFFKDPDKAKVICKTLLKEIVSWNDSAEDQLKGTFPIFTLGEFVIDFSRYVIGKTSGTQVGFVAENQLTRIKNIDEEILKRMGEWKSKTHWESLDGLYKVIINGDTGEIYRKFITPEGSEWYRYIDRPKDYFKNGLGNDILCAYSCHHENRYGHFLWHRTASQGKDAEIRIVDIKSKLKYLAKQTTEGFTLSKVDKNGRPLPVQQIDLKSLEKQHPQIYQSLHCGIDILGVTVFYNVEKQTIESVHYKNPMLDFYREEVQGKTILRSEQFPSYWLEMGARVDELGAYPYYLVMSASLQEKGVILLPLDVNSQRSDRSPVDQSSFINEEEKGHISFFSFNESTGHMMSNSALSNLHLTFLFAFLREYQKAFEYLPRCTSLMPYSRACVKIIEKYKRFTDRSPEALAFYLRFALQIIDHINQPIYQSTSNEPRDPLSFDFKYEDFKQWAADQLYRYFQVAGFRTIHRIPIDMRLNDIQLRVLLNNLRPEDQSLLKKLCEATVHYAQEGALKKEFQWATLNEIHYKTLESTERKFEGSLGMLPSYPIYPMEMHKWALGSVSSFMTAVNAALARMVHGQAPIIPNLYFIRIGAPFILIHFLKIYETIISSNDEELVVCDLALFYFTRTIGNNSHLLPLLTILNLVRRNPQKFKDLHFDDKKQAPAEMRQFCELILKRVSLFQEGWQKAKAIGSTIASVAIFGRNQTFSVSLPQILAIDKIDWVFPDELKRPIKDALAKPLNPLPPQYASQGQAGTPSQASRFIPDVKKEPKTKLEDYLWTQFTRGFEAAQREEEAKPAGTLSISSLKEELDSKLKVEVEAAANLKQEIERKANARPSDKAGKLATKVIFQDELHELKLLGKQTLKLEVDTVLLEAILMKDLRVIRRANPTLSTAAINEIVVLTIYYYARCCTRNRIQQALKVIDKIEKAGPQISSDHQNELQQLLHGTFAIDPFDEPEVLIYCYNTHRTLRPNQMKILKEIFKAAFEGKELSHLLFAFEAGGGKTDVLKVILKAIARRLGYIPLTVSPKSSMDNDAEKERAALVNAYNQRAAYIEVALHAKLSIDDLIHIRSYMEKCSREGLHPMITPITAFTLFLKYLVALYERDVEAVRHLSVIKFSQLLGKCFAFIDESRLTLGPLNHTMIGLGKPVPLPKEEQHLFLKVYRELFGFCKDPIKIHGQVISDVLRLQYDKQGEVLENELFEIKNGIAERMLNDPELNIPIEHRNSVNEYWLNPDKVEPEWIKQLSVQSPISYQLNVVLREFFYRILPFAISQVHGRDYGPDENHQVVYDVPKERKSDTHALFKNPYETLAITIQGFIQRGLSDEQIEKLVDKVVEIYESELRSGHTDSNSPMHQRWQSWANGKLPSLPQVKKTVHLDWSTFRLHIYYKDNFELLRKDNEAIFWYLEKEILPNVEYSPLSASVDACHLFGGFARVIAASAYPGIQQLYPFRPSKAQASAFIDDKIFPAKVMRELCDPRNSQMVSVDFETPDEFFLRIYEEDPKIYSDLCVIGDSYGMMRKFANIDVARAYLKFVRNKQKENQNYGKKEDIHCDGVILFHEGNQNKEGVTPANKRVHYRFLQYPDGAPVDLQGSDVKEALSTELGLRWEDLRLVTYYDIEHNTGEHVLQPEKGTYLFLLAEQTPISQGIQTLLRDRNFFLKTKRVVWATRKSLEKKIAQQIGANPTPPGKVAWMVSNEATLSAQEILARAYRQIAYLIQEPAYKELAEVLDDPKKQIERFHKNPQRFLEENFKNRYQEFAQSTALEDASKVLWDYAKALYQKYNYSAVWSKELPLYGEIEFVIQDVADKLGRIPGRNMAAAGERARIHVHQVQQVQQHQTEKVVLDLKPLVEANLDDSVHIFAHDLCGRLKGMSRSVRQLFGSPSLSLELYYTENAIQTVTTGRKPLAEKFLKPVEDLLLVQDEGKPLVGFAISNMEAAHFKKQLMAAMEGQGHNGLPRRQIALVTSTGILAQNGPGAMGFVWDKLVKETAFQDILIDVALLQGRICFQERLMERLKTWEDIWVLWDKVLACAALPKTIHRGAIEPLFPQAFKKAAPVEPQAKPAWSLFSIFKV